MIAGRLSARSKDIWDLTVLILIIPPRLYYAVSGRSECLVGVTGRQKRTVNAGSAEEGEFCAERAREVAGRGAFNVAHRSN